MPSLKRNMFLLLVRPIGRVDGGRYFIGGDNVKVEFVVPGKMVVTFDDVEKQFLTREALENDISVVEIFEMILGMLFVGGYKAVTGKE